MLKNRLSVYLSCTICFFLLPSVGFSGEKIIPKQGTWKGTPGVNFEVNSAGEILNFSLSPLIGPSTCTIAADKIIVGKNGYFGMKQYIQEKDYWTDQNISESERKVQKEKAIKAYGYWPRTITKDGIKMVESIHLTGKFNNPTSLTGNYIILNCDGQQFFHKKELYESGKKWSAELVK